MRIRALAAALALAAVPAVASAGPAHAAYQPFAPTIRCDEVAGTISTAATGGAFVPGTPLSVEFLVQAGSSVPAGGTAGAPLPVRGTSTTVSTVARADNSISVTGYTRAWQPAAYAFYTETVRVTVRNSAGQTLNWADATCTRDTRSTVTLSCDAATRTVTLRATGARYAAGVPVSVQYRLLKTVSQATPTSPRWTGYPLGGPPQAVHAVTADAAGGWADTGWVQSHPGIYYWEEHVSVTVVDRFGITVIGRGNASCSFTAA